MNEIVAYDPLRRGLKLEFRETFHPMGTRLVVESNREAVLEAARESFGRYPAVEDSSSPQYRVRLMVDPDFAESPPWADPLFRGHGNFLHIQVGRENFAVADLQQGIACGFVSPAMSSDSIFFRAVILECLFLVMLTHTQCTYLHASAVVWNGQAILLAGPRMAGKSTLAYACGRCDFQILSDDVVYIDRSRPFRIWGRPWHIRLLPDAIRFFTELRSVEPRAQINNEICLEVEVERFLPGRAIPHASAGAILFLERGGGPTCVEELSAEEAVSRMQSDLILDKPEVMRLHLEAWQDLARRVPAFRLRTAEDPYQTAEFVKDLCERRLA